MVRRCATPRTPHRSRWRQSPSRLPPLPSLVPLHTRGSGLRGSRSTSSRTPQTKFLSNPCAVAPPSFSHALHTTGPSRRARGVGLPSPRKRGVRFDRRIHPHVRPAEQSACGPLYFGRRSRTRMARGVVCYQTPTCPVGGLLRHLNIFCGCEVRNTFRRASATTRHRSVSRITSDTAHVLL
jgi:hypothetical protein